MWLGPIRLYTCRASKKKTALTKKEERRKEKPLLCHCVPSYVRLFGLCRITHHAEVGDVAAAACEFFMKDVKSTWSCRLCWSVAPSSPSSSISLPVLWAKQEGKDLNYISFSHVNDVRPPVSTPDGGCSEQRRAPRGARLCNGGRKYSRLLRRDRHQTQLQPYYKLEKLVHCNMNQRRKEKKEKGGNGLFTTDPHCNFAGRYSVGEMFVSCV